jgi:hypothetical protein
MSENLKAIAARYASALKASEVFTSDPEDRPSATDIWLWKLEDAVIRNVEYPHQPSADEYDHFALYAHRSCLKSKEDVYNAPDDVLLEALGLGAVESWGWLRFMVRDFSWFSLLAANWGLPAMRTDYGGHSDATEQADEDERRAEVCFHFIDLMRERGVDALAQAKRFASAFKEQYQQKLNKEISEEDFIKWLRAHNEWIYFVYTCRSVAIRPEAKGGFGKVAYSGDHRAQFRSQIRAAAERRRRNWNAEWSCECSPEKLSKT